MTPVSETAFTGRSRSAVNTYKRKFANTWKKNPPTNPERYTPNLETGLTNVQVKSRIDDCLVNYVKRGTTKSVGAIFFTNIFTFYNVLALIIGAILIYSITVLQPSIAPEVFEQENITKIGIPSLLFLLIFAANIGIGIFQELRSIIQS